MFTVEERNRVRARLLVAAQADPHVPAAAITGSTAIDTDDAWSDIDLAFAVDDVAAALERWTVRLYREFAALHHWDLPVGPTVYRVFLLPDCLEVDIAFTPVADFAPRGPSWRMAFGDDVTPRPSAASSRQFDQLAGLAWHHLLHARICIERGKPWQAEWLIGGTREQVLTLACLRFGHTTSYAKGTDGLAVKFGASRLWYVTDMDSTCDHDDAGRHGWMTRRLAAALGSAVALATSLIAWTGPPAQAAQTETVNDIATISYAPNSYVIGNAYPGWTDVIQGPGQFASGPGNPNGAYYRWGYLYGPAFDSCAWIADGQSTATAPASDMCGTPQQIDTPHFVATYTDGTVSPGAGDGSPTTWIGGAGCDTAYGNVEPWRVPATPGSPLALVPTHPLLWRYVSADGAWVMVRDTTPTVGGPNWYFVPRGCIALD